MSSHIKKENFLKLFFSVILSLISAECFVLYVKYMQAFASGTIQAGLKYYMLQAVYMKETYLIATVFLVFFLAVLFKGEKIFKLCYQYRFLIAFVVFVLCVCFEINGSSLGIWAGYFEPHDTGNIVGVSRAIRSDEWAVSTPMMISQYYNDFSYFSDIVRGTQTDMYLVYGQAVADIAIIFRPFYWGYLFLSAGKGLAFFWCGRLIALFLVSFEMFMLISNRDKRLSSAGACLIALAPVVQWWFAINGFVEMLIFAQLSVLLLYRYMNTDKSWLRAIIVLAVFICAGGFILTMYPAWEIPMAYVVLALGIWIIIDNYKGFHIKKRDILVIILFAVMFFLIAAHIYGNSKETIEAFMNTEYPGHRSETGGGGWKAFFNYFSNMWYALFGEGTGANVCESAQFIDFFPFCYIIPLVVLVKKRDKFIGIMLCAAAFLGAWCVVGFPEILAKITLMNYSTAARAFIVLGFVNVLLLIRGLSLSHIKISSVVASVVGVIVACGIYKVSTYISVDFYPSIKYIIITIIVFSVAFAMIMNIRTRWCKTVFSLLCVFIILFSGMLVNPVHRGIGPIDNSELVADIKKICEEEPDALWVVERLGFPYNNIPIMAGAKTINSTNVYPALERWEKIAGDSESTIYNRYAHINIQIKEDGPVEFYLDQADVFTVAIKSTDLRELDVHYILSNRDDLELYENDEINFDIIKQTEGYYIYEVYYD